MYAGDEYLPADDNAFGPFTDEDGLTPMEADAITLGERDGYDEPDEFPGYVFNPELVTYLGASEHQRPYYVDGFDG
jgi:hypothetical protein